MARRAAELAQRQADAARIANRRQDSPPESTLSFPQLSAGATDTARFVRDVRESFSGPLLHFSDRQRLLAKATRLGINRFEANLLIATVQHRLYTQPRQSITPEEPLHPPHRRWGRIIGLTVALLVTEFVAVRCVIGAMMKM